MASAHPPVKAWRPLELVDLAELHAPEHFPSVQGVKCLPGGGVKGRRHPQRVHEPFDSW